MKNGYTIILLITFFLSLACNSSVNNNQGKSATIETPGSDQIIKTIFLGEDNSEKIGLVSALTYYLSSQGLGKFIPKEALGIFENTFTVDNEVIGMDIVKVKTPENSHYLYVNEDPLVIAKFLSSKTINFDAAILVVRHTDGCMPYTRKHLEQLKKLGIKHLFCFVTKSELVDDPELSERIKNEILDLIASMQISQSNVTVVFGSTDEQFFKNNPEWMKSLKLTVDFLDNL